MAGSLRRACRPSGWRRQVQDASQHVFEQNTPIAPPVRRLLQQTPHMQLRRPPHVLGSRQHRSERPRRLPFPFPDLRRAIGSESGSVVSSRPLGSDLRRCGWARRRSASRQRSRPGPHEAADADGTLCSVSIEPALRPPTNSPSGARCALESAGLVGTDAPVPGGVA